MNTESTSGVIFLSDENGSVKDLETLEDFIRKIPEDRLPPDFKWLSEDEREKLVRILNK